MERRVRYAVRAAFLLTMFSSRGAVATDKLPDIIDRIDMAHLIVVGTIVDTSYIPCEGRSRVCTNYWVDVSEVLKGDSMNWISFATTRDRFRDPAVKWTIGDSLLGYFAPSGVSSGHPTELTLVRAPFVVSGDSVSYGSSADSKLSLAEVRTIVRNHLASYSLEALASNADLIVRATRKHVGEGLFISENTANDETMTIELDSVLVQKNGPRVDVRDELQVHFDRSEFVHKGTSPPPFNYSKVSDELIIPLKWEYSKWNSFSSVYAMWWIDGDSAHVYVNPERGRRSLRKLESYSVDHLCGLLAK